MKGVSLFPHEQMALVCAPRTQVHGFSDVVRNDLKQVWEHLREMVADREVRIYHTKSHPARDTARRLMSVLPRGKAHNRGALESLTSFDQTKLKKLLSFLPHEGAFIVLVMDCEYIDMHFGESPTAYSVIGKTPQHRYHCMQIP